MREIFFDDIGTYTIIIALVVALVFPARRRGFLLFATLAAAIFVATKGFLNEAGGQPLFADDHPSFIFRLAQLKEQFPFIPFYNPLWNAGVEAREFFPSGVLNLFLLASPLVYLFPVESIYNLIVIGLLFFMVPGLGLVLARYSGMGAVGSATAALLMMGASLMWYKWALTFGTMGFCVSAALAPLVVLLAARALNPDISRHWSERVVLTAALTLNVLWTPAALLLAPLSMVGLVRLPKLLKVRSFRWMVLAIVLINAPWLAIFIDASNVFSFVSSTGNTHGESAKKVVAITLTSFKKGLISQATAMNPLLWLGLLPGFRILCTTTGGWLYVGSCLWALLLGVCGPLVVPQLELDRFFVIFALMLPLPVASWVDSLHTRIVTRRANRSTTLRSWLQPYTSLSSLTAIAIVASLLLLPTFMWRLIHFKTAVKYFFADRIVQDFSATLRNLDGDGRILFSGFILHDFSGGHIAPLAYLTKRPLIASRYQHDRWHRTDAIPDGYRERSDEGVREYLSLMNASYVVAHEKFWREWFSARPSEYTLLEKKGHFWIFKRVDYTPSYFLKGTGEVLSQNGSSVVLRPHQDSVVIKFNYYRHLKSSDCTVAPYPVSSQVTFIELRGCKGAGPVQLSAVNPLERLRSLIPSGTSER